ncbi:MAG: hypothetical protein AAB883_02105 [Patescibacteria group bacterium]
MGRKTLPKAKLRFSSQYFEVIGETQSYVIDVDYVLSSEVVMRYQGGTFIYRTDPVTGHVYKFSGDIRVSDELYALMTAYATMLMKIVFRGYKKAQERRRATEVYEAERQIAGGLPAPMRKSTRRVKKTPVAPGQQRLDL